MWQLDMVKPLQTLSFTLAAGLDFATKVRDVKLLAHCIDILGSHDAFQMVSSVYLSSCS